MEEFQTFSVSHFTLEVAVAVGTGNHPVQTEELGTEGLEAAEEEAKQQVGQPVSEEEEALIMVRMG